MVWNKGLKISEETRIKISNAGKGRKCSQETKNRMAISKMGDKNPMKILEVRLKSSLSKKGFKHTEEHKEKIRNIAANNPNYGMKGKHQSKESRIKIGLASIGRHVSEETRKKLSEVNTGRIFSEEHKSNLRKSKQHISEETKIRMRENHPRAMLGRHHTEEARRKIGLAARNISQDTRDKMSISHSGDKTNFWNGGISFEPYSIEFNERFKEAIRIRDNCCMICNSNEKKGRKLNVHHIDYNKLNSTKENCIALCDSCHAKTNNNREQWITFFQSLLSKKYKYIYVEVIKI